MYVCVCACIYVNASMYMCVYTHVCIYMFLKFLFKFNHAYYLLLCDMS